MDLSFSSAAGVAASPVVEAPVLCKRGREAAAMLGSPVEAAFPLLSRGRNQLFRVSAPTGQYVLKCYGPADGTGPERFRRETRALAFLANGPLAPSVPRLIATNTTDCSAVIAWVEGEKPASRQAGDIVQLHQALGSLLAVSRGAEAAEFPSVGSSCTRPAEFARQVEARRDGLGKPEGDIRLIRLLNQFDAIWPMVKNTALTPQDPARLVLSPVNFGLHAALRRQGGGLVFLDFEDFGWDDPARLVADLLWRSAPVLTPDEAVSIRNAAQSVFGACDGGFSQRFARIWPALGLRWALVALEALLPANAQRHKQAKGMWEATKQHHLDKAAECLARVRDGLRQMAA